MFANRQLFIPVTTYQKIYGTRASVSALIKVRDIEEIHDTVSEVTTLMRIRHSLRPKDRNDFDWACSVVREHSLDEMVDEGALAAILFSPVWGELDLEQLAKWTLAQDLPIRLQLQLHKIIWDPDARGV